MLVAHGSFRATARFPFCRLFAGAPAGDAMIWARAFRSAVADLADAFLVRNSHFPHTINGQ